MRLESTPLPGNPTQAFGVASTHYKAAIDAITFEPNERVDVRAAVSSAIGQAEQAVLTLAPFAADSNPFVGRNAASSIETATAGVSALKTALATLQAPGAGMPQIPVSTFLEIAQRSLTAAEGILWQE